MKRGTYPLPKTPLPLRAGMSNQAYEARQGKQRIYDDLVRKQDKLNTSLITMLQVGPESLAFSSLGFIPNKIRF